MDLWATKTHAEREDEEAERLTRPAPKQKPPRHDKRRERMDPDKESDPDMTGDPDLSQNYKNIGGAVVRRWAAKQEKIPAKSKETGKTVLISPETLKKEPGKYEEIEREEEEPKPEEAPPEEAPPPRKKPKKPERAEEPDAEEAGAEEAGAKEPDITKSGDFQKFLADMPTSDVSDDKVLVLDPKTKNRVPFDQLDDRTKDRLVESFTAQKRSAELQGVLKEAGPGVENVLLDLKDPGSLTTQRIQQFAGDTDPSEIAAERVFPELRGKLPKGTSLAEIKAAAEAFEAPSEAERAGIKPPKREKASEAERMEAARLLMDTFPPEMAAELMGKGLHPTDVREMVSSYNAAKTRTVKNVQEFAKEASEFFETDPDRVKPPQSWVNAAGDRVPFEKLSPEEQSEAMRQHQMRTMAMSMAAKEQLAEELTQPSLMGRPKIPPGLADTLATFMLHKGGLKDAEQFADQMFHQAAAGGAATQLQQLGTKEKHIGKLLKSLPPGARKLAESYFQAADYQQAKLKFLGAGKDEESFDERSKPKDIFKGIKKASDFFDERSKQYQSEVHRAKDAFRIRVLDRLRALEPEKYQEVRSLMDQEEAGAYKKARAKWEKEKAAWEARKQEWERKHMPFRDRQFDEPEPEPPKKPPRYALAEPKEAKKEAERLWEEMQASRSKVASRVLQKFRDRDIFTCRGGFAMGQNATKQGVYHGVDPQAHYPEPYPGWQQVHERDIGEADYEIILSAARQWLEAPVLSLGIDGITRDQQLRAALDLGLKSSKYDSHIDPNTYNMLLAKLAGVPKPGQGETLTTLTARADSPYPHTLKNEVISMKASHEVRRMAAKVANTNPGLAFDLTSLADRLAAKEQQSQDQDQDKEGQQDKQQQGQQQQKEAGDKYTALKSLVIRTAASDSGAKKVLTPVLQKIKELG